MTHINKNTKLVKALAQSLGFEHCGIAAAHFLEDDARRLEAWLNKGFQGTMYYMEKYFDMRTDPGKLVPGARSVVTLLMNYFPAKQQAATAPKIAKYAYGKDYHEVIREKLGLFLQQLREQVGEVQGRGFVDSAPVLERSWAQQSGLGWIGKNGNLINRSSGSFYFIATLITDLELETDTPLAKDFCGSCNRCVEACPTEAILPNKVIDGSRCISYFTIELKDALIPASMQGRFDNWMFGCDTCQDVCPWNRFARVTQEQSFEPIPQLLNLSTREWEEMSEEQFRSWFKHSPLSRAKYKGVMRNVKFLAE